MNLTDKAIHLTENTKHNAFNQSKTAKPITKQHRGFLNTINDLNLSYID